MKSKKTTLALIFLLTFCFMKAQKVTVLPAKTFINDLTTKNISENQLGVKGIKSSEIPVQDFKEKVISQPENPKEKPSKTGDINWTQGYLEAKGKAYFNGKHVANLGLDYAREMAKIGAEADARANLLAMVQAVTIYDTVRVVDKITEQKITIQVLVGAIKARQFGSDVYGDNWVEVAMRCDIDGNDGSVRDFVDKQKMTPPQEQIVTEQQKQEALGWLLQEYKKAGIVEPNATVVPPLVAEVPKAQAENYQPSLLPSVGVECNGKGINVDLSKYFQVNDPKALAIVNASRELIKSTGITDKVPVLNGYINDGNITLDLCAIIKDKQKDQRRQKIAEGFKKFGNILLQAIPIVAMFI